MSQAALPLPAKRHFGQTSRRDAWWVEPLVSGVALIAFLVYATWAAFQGNHYHYGNYLSPFYSPELFGDSPHAMFGPKPGWWPDWIKYSPALLILWAPGGFRFTCYYYRGAYYKAHVADPPACTVGEPRFKYVGESRFPLIMQNLHRYFLYFALIFLVFLSYDVWKAFWFTDPATGRASFGVGVGTLVLLINVVLLSLYAFSCHSLRHILGGRGDRISKAPLGARLYNCSTCLNARHSLYAWPSLVWVAFADVYVRLCSMGVWTDWRLF